MYKVSLSTMWGIGRFDHMADFVTKGKALGFCCFELNHQVTPGMLDELLAIHRQGEILISSIHDPCPNGEEGLMGKPKVSDLQEEARQAAVALSKRTMDLAADVGAAFVVLHIGDVAEMTEPALALRGMYRNGSRDAPDYGTALDSFQRGMAHYGPAHLQAVARSLEELVPYAEQRGLALGLENRYYVHEIPTLEQALWLLERFPDGAVGYWHDLGHAEVQERLGLATHEDWLNALGDRIIGVHLHDVAGISDHQSIGLGDVDLRMVLRHLPPGALRVCEFDKRNAEEQVAAGLERLAQLGYLAPAAEGLPEPHTRQELVSLCA